MNRFLQHHDKSIRLVYGCFDRIVLNGWIQPFHSLPSVVWFFRERRDFSGKLDKKFFRDISSQYHQHVQQLSQSQHVAIVVPDQEDAFQKEHEGRRENLVQDYYRRLPSGRDLAVILKAREPAPIVVSRPTSGEPHLENASRWVWQYTFYVRDDSLGPLWIRVCPYFPFPIRVCLNGHGWLAARMKAAGISFRQQDNSFLTCSDPDRLQQLSDAFDPQIINFRIRDVWLPELLPFFSKEERLSYWPELFVSQIEYCTNVVFHRRATVAALNERLLDLNRSIGRPDRISTIYQRRMHPDSVKTCKTRVAQYDEFPVLRCFHRSQSVKQYLRSDGLNLRTENTSNNVRDLGIGKSLENLPRLREKMQPVNDRFLDVQQDVLETYLDRGGLARLRKPTVQGKRRIPGMKLDDPRLLALMKALAEFAPLSNGGEFRTKDLQASVCRHLGKTPETYKLSQLRYDLGKLRAKRLVVKVAGTQSYRLTETGYQVCVFFIKCEERLLAPVVSSLVRRCEPTLPRSRQSRLDRCYRDLTAALTRLGQEVGLGRAA